jgi:cell division protein FtsW (lipid II flippase)
MKAFFVGRHRRNSELVLIILSGVATTGAYVLAAVGRLSSIPANVLPFLIVVLGLFFAAHVATRFLAPEADGLLLPLAGLLNGLGYVFIARLNDELAAQQAVWTFLGVGLYCLTLLIVRRSHDLEQFRYILLLFGLLLLVLPLMPVIGQTINGSRIWVRVGPVNFQPGEFAKLALAIFFASYLVDKRELFRAGTWRVGPLRLPEPKHVAPVLLAWGVSLLVMISQKDLGTSLLFFMLFLLMLWVSTERLAYLLTGMVLFMVGAYIAWTQFDHVQTRVDAWLKPWDDPLGSGYQVIEAQFGLASGGITGTGPGRGYPQRVPAAETDFIFATIGEELGLLGATAVLMAFLLMIGSGLRAALGARRPFSKLLATGLTGLLGVQAFIIIAGVTRVLPLTGVTLPFVSYGGSSLLANYAILAIIVRISDEQTDRPVDAPAPGRRRPKVAAGAR